MVKLLLDDDKPLLYKQLKTGEPRKPTEKKRVKPRVLQGIIITPWKINMEPTNHPIRKENHLPNLHDYVPAVNLQGCTDYDKYFQPPP